MANSTSATSEKLISLNNDASASNYADAHNFFNKIPLSLAKAEAPAPTDNSFANSDGMVQFHLIGQKPTDPKWSDIMNENQDNLLSIGGLIFDYMHTNYPNISPEKLDLKTWLNVVSHIPDLSIGSAIDKQYTNKLLGTKISGEFLSMIASAIITDAASLVTDFQSFLQSIGNVVFSANTKSEVYNVITCTYQSYLIDNGAGSYYDYGAIVLRSINFTENFLELNSSCASAKYVNIAMKYTEITNLVQLRKIRQGGADYEKFQALVNKNSTAQFSNAANFFNGGNTPQNEIKPNA